MFWFWCERTTGYVIFQRRKHCYGLWTHILPRSNSLKLVQTRLDSHSNGTHSHRIHWASDAMLNVSKSVPMKNQTPIWLAWPEGESFSVNLYFWVNYSFKYNFQSIIRLCRKLLTFSFVLCCERNVFFFFYFPAKRLLNLSEGGAQEQAFQGAAKRWTPLHWSAQVQLFWGFGGTLQKGSHIYQWIWR